jgi:hypothetical protein
MLEEVEAEARIAEKKRQDAAKFKRETEERLGKAREHEKGSINLKPFIY